MEDCNIVIHKIQPGDTLMSLSLDYGIPTLNIKKANGLMSEDIYYLKELKIPNPSILKIAKAKKSEEILAIERQNLMVEGFSRRLEEDGLDREDSRQMLIDCNWDYDKLIDDYENKKNWKKEKNRKEEELTRKIDKADRCKEIVQYYLDMNNYNVDQAYAEYCLDRDSVKDKKAYPNLEDFEFTNTNIKKVGEAKGGKLKVL